MKTGNAAAFSVLPGSGPAVLQYGFRDLGVSGFAGVRGAARPPDGVKVGPLPPEASSCCCGKCLAPPGRLPPGASFPP